MNSITITLYTVNISTVDFRWLVLPQKKRKTKLINRIRRTWGRFGIRSLHLIGQFGFSFFCNGTSNLKFTVHCLCRKANRTETVKEYRQKVAMVPWDLSRRAFMQLAASPEAFLMLRSHFTRSYATVCMCHYALGIGDRHLSNFMVDLHSGGAVGIDFGHAFGTATQVSN